MLQPGITSRHGKLGKHWSSSVGAREEFEIIFDVFFAARLAFLPVLDLFLFS